MAVYYYKGFVIETTYLGPPGSKRVALWGPKLPTSNKDYPRKFIGGYWTIKEAKIGADRLLRRK